MAAFPANALRTGAPGPWSTPCSPVDPSRPALDGRLVSYIDRELDSNFARFGINRAAWDVLASLRRSGPPFRLTPTELYRGLMRTSGAVANQLRRLEEAGLVRRLPDPHDRRSTLVELTKEGRALVQRVVPSHLETERRILGALDPGEQAALAGLLKKLLLSCEQG